MSSQPASGSSSTDEPGETKQKGVKHPGSLAKKPINDSKALYDEVIWFRKPQLAHTDHLFPYSQSDYVSAVGDADGVADPADGARFCV
jgi:hypothetical protein